MGERPLEESARTFEVKGLRSLLQPRYWSGRMHCEWPCRLEKYLIFRALRHFTRVVRL